MFLRTGTIFTTSYRVRVAGTWGFWFWFQKLVPATQRISDARYHLRYICGTEGAKVFLDSWHIRFHVIHIWHLVLGTRYVISGTWYILRPRIHCAAFVPSLDVPAIMTIDMIPLLSVQLYCSSSISSSITLRSRIIPFYVSLDTWYGYT